jgi:hypothetical protein
MRRIFSFKQYLNEQKKPAKGNPTEGSKMAAQIATTLFNTALKELGLEPGQDFSSISETDETKKSLPYTGCGNTPYTFVPSEITNKDLIAIFSEGGKFANDIRYVDLKKEIESKTNRIFLVGIRETLDIRKAQGDKFVDKIAIADPTKPNEKVISYPITTCPSVTYYSDPAKTLNMEGVAIMLPDVVKYKIGIHRPDTPSSHEALIQNGEMEIERFKIGEKKAIDTYRPDDSTKTTKPDLGINIHRGSTGNGVCVGPYSAGCQVFANGSDFDTFMSKMKSSTANGGNFLYALVENDEIIGSSVIPSQTAPTTSTPSATSTPAAKKTSKTKAEAEDQKS